MTIDASQRKTEIDDDSNLILISVCTLISYRSHSARKNPKLPIVIAKGILYGMLNGNRIRIESGITKDRNRLIPEQPFEAL
jgi:hypothetical protein